MVGLSVAALILMNNAIQYKFRRKAGIPIQHRDDATQR